MARSDLINRLYAVNKTPLEFKFQNLMAPPLLSLLSPYDINMLNSIALDPKLSSKLTKKLGYIKEILEPRGFVKFHSGTNRIVYRFLEDQSFLIKIALDKGGISDNPMEYKNQFLLAPFITKVFESTPCGTVGLFERVEPITSRQEFISIAEDVFDLLNDKFIGKYVLEDIGTDYFMNWGVRLGFGPVLLDFPYCYELDGNKMYCNATDPFTGGKCDGPIDYDNGFNNLLCNKCRAKVFARTLQTDIETKNIIVKGRREHSTMKIKCIVPGKETKTVDTTITARTYAEGIKKKKSDMSVQILNNRPPVDRANEVKELAKAAAEAADKRKSRDEDEANDERVELLSTLDTKLEDESIDRNIVRHEPQVKASAPYGRQDEKEDQDISNEVDDEGVEYIETEEYEKYDKIVYATHDLPVGASNPEDMSQY